MILGGIRHDTPAEEARLTGLEIMRRWIARVGQGRANAPIGEDTEGSKPPCRLPSSFHLQGRDATTACIVVSVLRKLKVLVGQTELRVTIQKARKSARATGAFSRQPGCVWALCTPSAHSTCSRRLSRHLRAASFYHRGPSSDTGRADDSGKQRLGAAYVMAQQPALPPPPARSSRRSRFEPPR